LWPNAMDIAIMTLIARNFVRRNNPRIHREVCKLLGLGRRNQDAAA
jgi:hypothetical protein